MAQVDPEDTTVELTWEKEMQEECTTTVVKSQSAYL